MIRGEKKLSRRKLLGGMGKLAYVAPVLTMFSLGAGKTHAFSVPCPPNDPCDVAAGGVTTKRKPRVESRRKKPGG